MTPVKQDPMFQNRNLQITEGFEHTTLIRAIPPIPTTFRNPKLKKELVRKRRDSPGPILESEIEEN